jgi:hypothetical protein
MYTQILLYILMDIELLRQVRLVPEIHRVRANLLYSDILHGIAEDVCKALKYQEKALDDVAKLFESFEDLRQHANTGVFIASSVLRIVEAKSIALDELCTGIENMKTANTENSKALDRISSHLRDIKEDRSTSKALRRVDEKLIQIEQQACLERHRIIEQYNRQYITSLPSIPYFERRRQAYAVHEPGTGAWFLSHNRFRSWKDSDAASTLVCTGPPGTGKTVLTSLAIDDISKSFHDENIQIAYLFCQYKHQANETAPVLFSSILRQLLTSRGVMLPFIRDKCLELFSKPSVAQKLLRQLIKLVRILCGATQRTYILVDAVDEVLETDPCGKDVRNEFLRGLFELSHQCRLLITCRTHIDITVFSATSTFLHVCAKGEDFFAYCASTISASKVLLDFCKRRPGLRNEIIRAVKAKANGV